MAGLFSGVSFLDIYLTLFILINKYIVCTLQSKDMYVHTVPTVLSYGRMIRSTS